LGGTGSGKTVAAAHKTAKHVLETRPPEHGAKFWVISYSKEQVGGVCWKEKLSGMIPKTRYSISPGTMRVWDIPKPSCSSIPTTIVRSAGYLEFKSYEQGLAAFTGANIGGYWFNEEVPYELVAEVMGRTRQWGSPGWADFTPIECRDPEWPEKYNQPPADWRFYHLNSQLNFYNAPGWYESQKAHWPEDTIELRTIGKFTALHGAIFKEFRRHIHVLSWDKFRQLTGKSHIPKDWPKRRGIDFGYGNPFVCLWGARNKDGIWFIYDEHYRAQAPLEEHAREINKRTWDATDPNYGPTFSDHDLQDMAELSLRGINCTPAVKHKPKVAIDYVRSLMMQMPRKPLYRIAFVNSRGARVEKLPVSRIEYDGFVYCVTVPNGTLIVRRGDKQQTMVCGNCLWGARNRDGIWFIYDEHYRAQAPLEEHAREINKRTWDATDPNYGPTFSDHDLQDMAELSLRGINCTPAVKHKPKVAIDYVRSLMMQMPNKQPRLYILENCRNLLKELPAWKWKEGTDGRDPKDEPVDKDDHSCDALLYMIYSDHAGYQKQSSSGFKKKPNYKRRGVLIPGSDR
jgi:phage terminase large subunit-like protein/uncharacterized protein YneF (UPF0154 family)